MSDLTFSNLWENVDYDLHKTTNILKGAIAIGEYTQHDEETVLGLVYVALEQVEEARHQLDKLRKCGLAEQKEMKKAKA